MIGRHASRWIPAYCDGQLPPRKAQTIAAHLERCERCRRECDEVRFAAALLREMPIKPAPDDLWTGIERHLGERQVIFIKMVASTAASRRGGTARVADRRPHLPPVAARPWWLVGSDDGGQRREPDGAPT